MPARGAPVRLLEALEHVGQDVRRNPDSVVAHRQAHHAPAAGDDEVDASSGGRELDGVRQQVPHHLLQAPRVAEDGRPFVSHRQAHLEPLGEERRPHGVDCRFDYCCKIHVRSLQGPVGADDAGYQEIVDVPRLHTLRCGRWRRGPGAGPLLTTPRLSMRAHPRIAESGVRSS